MDLKSATRAAWAGAAAYAALVLYLSLFPLAGWKAPAGSPFSWLGHIPTISRTDMLANVLVYVPLGLLVAIATRGSLRVAAAVLAGLTLSVSAETLQAFLPGRVSSVLDVMTNALGTAIGAVAGLVIANLHAKGRLKSWRAWFEDGAHIEVGLAAILLWLLTQTTPFVPSIDIGSLKQGYKPLYYAWSGRLPFQPWEIASYAATVGAIGLTARLATRGWLMFAAMLGIILGTIGLKGVVVGRFTTADAVLGATFGIAVAGLAGLASRRKVAGSLLAMVVLAVVVPTIAPRAGGSAEFNWVPFAGHLYRPLGALEGVLEALWPALAGCCAVAALVSQRAQKGALTFGGVMFVSLVFMVELIQQWVPGRYGDVTTPMLFAGGWAAGTWWIARSLPAKKKKERAPSGGSSAD